MDDPVSHLIPPPLVQVRSRIRSRPKLLHRPPPNADEQKRSLEPTKPRALANLPMFWHRWGVVELLSNGVIGLGYDSIVQEVRPWSLAIGPATTMPPTHHVHHHLRAMCSSRGGVGDVGEDKSCVALEGKEGWFSCRNEKGNKPRH